MRDHSLEDAINAVNIPITGLIFTRDTQALCVWLDTQGNLVAIAAPGFEPSAIPAAGWLTYLSTASRILWATILWPTLTNTGRLEEVTFEMTSESTDQRVPVVSSWRATTHRNVASAAWLGVLTPATVRQQLVQDLRNARVSLASIPGALLQFRRSDAGRWQIPYASEGLLDLLSVTPTRARAAAEYVLEALEPLSRAHLLNALDDTEAQCHSHFKIVLTPARYPLRRIDLECRQDRAGVWHAVITDASEREHLHLALQEQLRTDPLTQLPNRAGVMSMLHERLQTGRSYALYFMDCDRFKQINDSLGHSAGDEFLRHLGRRLKHGLRIAGASATDFRHVPVAARLGGDEFIVVVDGIVETDAADAIAVQLLSLVAQPIRISGIDLTVTMSIGVVLAGPGGEPEAILRDADTAMYAAKRECRGGWRHFAQAMHTAAVNVLALEMDLRQALLCGQIRSAYQPIIESTTGRVVGLEALARWRHATRGDVPPAQFIEAAESAGLIADLGLFMLRSCCHQWVEWLRSGIPLPSYLSVNLSRSQIADPHFPSKFTAILAETGMTTDRLQFEVTETVSIENRNVLSRLRVLRSMGVRIALDDFGIGMSSLSALNELPIQQVKLDRFFIGGMDNENYKRALIGAVVNVARALQLEVLAEGVETVAQAESLTELGVRIFQGFLYSQALEARDIPKYIIKNFHQSQPIRLPLHPK